MIPTEITTLALIGYVWAVAIHIHTKRRSTR